MRKAFFSIIIIISILAGCNDSENSQIYTDKSPSREVMGTFARSIAVALDKETAKAANEAAFGKLVEIDEMMSDYLFDSELSKVNREAYEHAVAVSDELFEVLKRSVEYSRMSEGSFDVTIGPVVELWRSAKESGFRPSEEEIEAATEKVGYKKLILNEKNQTVRFASEGMLLDLGAIAKGFGIDMAIEAMKDAGAIGGMVDAGGDIRCFGKPAKKNNWIIGLQNPGETDKLMMKVEIGEKAVATSGDYQRFVILDGEKLSHILTPQKGVSTKGLTSVSVIADTAMDADALATAVTVMGIERGLEMIETIEGAECFAVPSKPGEKLYFSSGFSEYVLEGPNKN